MTDVDGEVAPAGCGRCCCLAVNTPVWRDDMASRDSRHPSRVGMPCRMGRYPVSLCDGGGRDTVSVAGALRVDERGNYGRRDGGIVRVGRGGRG